VIFGSSCFKLPEAKFLVFAYAVSHFDSLSLFIFSNSSFQIKTSHLNEQIHGIWIFNFCGIDLIVFTLAVTSSQIYPSHLVIPCTNIQSS
jgi:hypothetical protein